MYNFAFPYKNIKIPYPQAEIKAALQPSVFQVDPDHWRHKFNEFTKLNEAKRTEILAFNQNREFIVKSITQTLQNRNWSLSFNVLGLRNRCGRRYPFITNKKTKSHLLTIRNTDNIKKNSILLSGLHKKFRKTFRAKEGYRIIYFDLNRAHFMILGMLSNDQELIAAAKGDPHTYTGKLFAHTISDKNEQREIGKTINSAIVSGATEKWLIRELKENNIEMKWNDVRVSLNAWWENYPNALAYKNAHQEMIIEKQKNNEQHKLKIEKRHLYYFDYQTLNGTNDKIKKWPTTVNGRVKKVQRSAFSAELRAYEAFIMDYIFCIAHKYNMELILPIYDGAMWQIPEDLNLDPFKKDVSELLNEWGFLSGFSIDDF